MLKLAPNTVVFVYGTLKRGFGNERVMHRGGGEFVREASTAEARWTMRDVGGCFPAVTDGGEHIIHGELWTVDDFAPLDRLEGYPHHYDRQLVTLDDGTEAWMYFQHPYAADERDIIESGEWAAHDHSLRRRRHRPARWDF